MYEAGRRAFAAAGPNNPVMTSLRLPHNPEREAQAIREQRRRFNEAIAAHDARKLDACWLADIHVSTSAGQPIVGRAAYQRAFEQFFALPDFVAFVRTPTRVTVGEDGRSAAEIGEWAGQWRRAAEQRGQYMASWHKEGGRWLIQAELYVPLSAEPSAQPE